MDGRDRREESRETLNIDGTNVGLTDSDRPRCCVKTAEAVNVSQSKGGDPDGDADVFQLLFSHFESGFSGRSHPGFYVVVEF